MQEQLTSNPPQRRRMAPEERRQLILDAAQRLFAERGWDAVTVADVLTEAGISKGGFYHHFSAKEDLLDGLVERLAEQIGAAARDGWETAEGGALARFNTFLSATTRWKADRGAELRFLINLMQQPGNEVLSYRINAVSARVIRPLLVQMIREGQREGAFDVTSVDLAADTIIAISQGGKSVLEQALHLAQDGETDAASRLLSERAVAEGAFIDRILGLPQGSVVPTGLAECRNILTAMIGGGGGDA